MKSHSVEQNVIVIDDDRDFSASLVQLLELEDQQVRAFDNANVALKHITLDYNGVVLLDVSMPGISGEDVLTQLMQQDASLPVIHITGHGDIPMAVRALKKGAYGFFTKPLNIDELLRDIQKAQAARRVEIERRKLARQIAMRDNLFESVVGTSRSMVKLRQLILKIGSASCDVLIQGESGVGKSVVTKALLSVSVRSEGPMEELNCGHHGNVDEVMFGVELPEGQYREGCFHRLKQGTLVLDDIDSMPLAIQARFLKALEERAYESINGTYSKSLDVRIIATTKVDLLACVTAGHFREDLYYRLQGACLVIPPLRERGADPVILFEHFLTQSANTELEPVTPSLMSDLLSYDWPGNVRELKYAAERFAAGLHVFAAAEDGAERSDSLSKRVAAFEKGLIEATLAHYEGSIKRTMLELDVPRKTLYDKMTKYQIDRELYLRN